MSKREKALRDIVGDDAVDILKATGSIPSEPAPTSWAMEVIADSTGEWSGNAIRLATKLECDNYGLDLAMRWTAVRDVHSIESDDPVNYRWSADGGLQSITTGPSAHTYRGPTPT